DINLDGLARVQSELGEAVATAPTDVTQEAAVETLVARALDQFGRLDVAVANAGGGAFAPVGDPAPSEWQGGRDVGLTSTFLTIKHAGAAMADGGSIVAIASLNATQPAAGMSAYCTAKAGVAMLTRVAAMELGSRRIRVNAIAPGLVETPMSA